MGGLKKQELGALLVIISASVISMYGLEKERREQRERKGGKDGRVE